MQLLGKSDVMSESGSGERTRASVYLCTTVAVGSAILGRIEVCENNPHRRK